MKTITTNSSMLLGTLAIGIFAIICLATHLL